MWRRSTQLCATQGGAEVPTWNTHATLIKDKHIYQPGTLREIGTVHTANISNDSRRRRNCGQPATNGLLFVQYNLFEDNSDLLQCC